LYFSESNNLEKLNLILNGIFPEVVQVKNGFATLNDNFFIGNFQDKLENEFLIRILKGSTGKWYDCIFPYRNNKVVDISEIMNFPKLYAYFSIYKDELQHRSIDKNGVWFGFGRSQGINDVPKQKIAINSLIKTIKDLKITALPPGTAVYSGLYILGDISVEKVKDILRNDDFVSYIKLLSKYKSGGYYTFSTSDVKKYLNYTLSLKTGGLTE